MGKDQLNIYLLTFLDCIRDAFNEDAKKNNLNCTLPWIESMKGALNYSEDTTQTCKTANDYQHADYFGLEFAAYAADYNHSKCPGNLQVKNYLILFAT